jgi:acyl-homoserine-lactone acylase
MIRAPGLNCGGTGCRRWLNGFPSRRSQEESGSFLKKRTKKLLDFGVRDPASVNAKGQKFFASFFQKRRPSFLALAQALWSSNRHTGAKPEIREISTMTTRPLTRALLAATAFGLTAAATPVLAQQTGGTILWDQYAVPHIYGPDIPTVVRGLGYAQMENQAETLLNNVARARGRSAEYFGAGPGNFNITYDQQVWTYGIPQRAAAWVAQGGNFQLQVLEAFCAGVNEYAANHPTDIPAVLKPVLPLVPSDITAGELNTIWFTFLPEQDGDPTLISAWQAGGMDAARKVESIHRAEGSNGWALAPSKTADGNPTLMGNPHLPWGNNQPIPNYLGGQAFGVYQWIEANLVIGNPNSPSLNASGVTFVGGPFIGIGFNDYLGWTHTNDTIQNADLFQVTLDSSGQNYLFNGSYVPLQHTQHTLKILQSNGTYTTQVLDIYNDVHGPLVAFNSNHSQALALRVPGLNQPSLVTQYWDMIRAKTLKDFKAAESMLQMPFFNTIFADRSGDIFYLFGGQQPVRQAGTPYADYDKIQDGTTSANLWTQTLNFSQLPQATNPSGGFVANSNNPPWTSAFPQPATLDPAAFPTYIAPNFMDFRPQHGANFLLSQPNFTYDQILAGKMSNEMLLADRVLPDLITLATAAANGGDTTAAKAVAILNAWDHTANATSVGGVLFEEWWNEVVAGVQAGTIIGDHSDSFYSPHPAFRVKWNAKNPLTTPIGLNTENNAALLAALDNAFNVVSTNFSTEGGASVQWGGTYSNGQTTIGGAHRTTLSTHLDPLQEDIGTLLSNEPLSGADDPFGPIRVVNPVYIGADGEFISIGGDGYVQLIEFTPTGSQGGTLLTYGNASRPNSPHITDQLPFFRSFTLKPALRTYSAVQAAAVSTETY